MSGLEFACRTAVSRVVRANGLDLHVLESGVPGRPGLCFLHGGSAHAHWFDLVTPAFSDRFHVIALDQRGHGASQWAVPPAYATEHFVSDLVAVMDALGWRQVILVGHSMGGHNSMACSAWRPERVRGLVVVDSRPMIPADRLGMMHERGRRPPRRHPSIDAAVSSFRLRPRETLADPRLLEHLVSAGFHQKDGAWIPRFDPSTSGERRPVDAWSLVDRIQAPTLIARAELSGVLPREMAEKLCAAIAGAELVDIPGAYHHLTLDRPREFVAALDAFLARLV